MSKRLTLLEEKASLQVFKKLLNKHIRTEEAIVNLNKIPQWVGFMKSFNITNTPLCDTNTLLINGYFYNFTTSVPTKEQLLKALRIGEEYKVDFYMVPTVREVEDASILEDFEFWKVPSYIESIFEIEEGVDLDIRKRIGSKDFREIRRLAKKAEQEYPFFLYTSKDLQSDGSLLNKAASLINLNAKKYNHSFNYFDYFSLKILSTSKLKENLLIGLRYERESMTPVQAVICLIDAPKSELFILVQGKDDDRITKGHNLYSSTDYHLFKYAERLGLKTIYEGRGSYKDKKKIGVNKTNILNNWVKCNSNANSTLIEAYKIFKERSSFDHCALLYGESFNA